MCKNVSGILFVETVLHSYDDIAQIFFGGTQNYYKENNQITTEVTSPTFNILNEYQIEKIKINHYDLYRLNSVDEHKDLNLFDDKLNSITLIEWPQKIIEKPKQLIELSFEYAKDYKKRFVQVKGLSL